MADLPINNGALVPPNNGQPAAPTPSPYFKPMAPITFGSAPGLTANFASNPKTTVPAPAVVTSDAANDHIDKMTTAANTATSDMQNTAAAKIAANNPPATDNTNSSPAQNSGTAGTSSTPDTSDTTGSQSSEILNSLYSALGLDGGSANADGSTPNNGMTSDQNTLDNQTITDDNAAIGIDQDTLSQVSDNLSSMENGTFPLPATQQAQVDNIKSTYIGALQTAQEYVKDVGGGAAAANTDLQQYSPALAMANIHAAIASASSKVATVNSNLISAQSKLTTALQNQDYTAATRLYTQINDDIKNRSDEIDKINTAVQTATDKMQTNALAVAKLQISTLTAQATTDATAAYRAQQLILSNARLTETERKDAFDELNTANGTRTAAERSAQALSQFGAAFVPGATMADGTPTVDEHGYITPSAFKAAIAEAPAEGLTRSDFIKEFGSMLYSDPKTGISSKYGLTPAEIKLINGALPAAGS